MTFVLVGSLGLLLYIYAGYPLLCAVLAVLRRRRVERGPFMPRISVLTSAYNEARTIDAAVRNKLGLQYPPELLEVIVVSDASDDGTDQIVSTIAAADPRVRLLRQNPRAGKTAALNRAAAAATGEVLVFADANSLYAPDALLRLVEPFADPCVGYATGQMVYRSTDGSITGRSCSTYMRYENLLRSLETGFGSVVGVDGGIDAVRAELFAEMRPDQQPDFILPLSVAERGRRVVYVPEAILYEDALDRPGDEFRMRIRVTLRAWHALQDKAHLLNPFRYGLLSWQIFSHKWLRYLAPVFQLLALVSNAFLVGASPLWALLMALQIVFYFAAALGLAGARLPGALSFPYYLCLVNAAAATALTRFLRGERQVTWTPRS